MKLIQHENGRFDGYSHAEPLGGGEKIIYRTATAASGHLVRFWFDRSKSAAFHWATTGQDDHAATEADAEDVARRFFADRPLPPPPWPGVEVVRLPDGRLYVDADGATPAMVSADDGMVWTQADPDSLWTPTPPTEAGWFPWVPALGAPIQLREVRRFQGRLVVSVHVIGGYQEFEAIAEEDPGCLWFPVAVKVPAGPMGRG